MNKTEFGWVICANMKLSGSVSFKVLPALGVARSHSLRSMVYLRNERGPIRRTNYHSIIKYIKIKPGLLLSIIQKSRIIEQMKITREEIDHLAELSNFSLSDAEKDSLGQDLQNIIGYISQLDELDTSGVEPTYQVFEMENVWREDEILEQDADREALLALAPDSQDYQIKVPKVL